MYNLWYEFLVEKFVEEETDIRCCGSCQGGCLNPAICAFICMGIPVDSLKSWYSDNQDRLRGEWEEKLAREEEEYYNSVGI